MSYGDALQKTSGLPGSSFVWASLAFLAVAYGLALLQPASRNRIAASLLLFVLALAGLVSAATLAWWKNGTTGDGYAWIRSLSLLMQSIAVVNLGGVVVFKVIFKSLRLEPPPILRDLILAVAYLVVGLGVLSSAGVNLAGLVATSAVVTAVIGFSLQDTLGNIMGGMALQAERSIGRGDWVRVGEHEGVVKEIRWRQTSIETRAWDTIIIPNSQLMKAAVTVLGRRTGQPRQRQMSLPFNVDFRFAPNDVINAVQNAMRLDPIADVASQPAPQCILSDFKDSSAVYIVRYWLTDLAADQLTNSAVRCRIVAALKRAGITLSIPAQTLFVTEDDQNRRQRKAEQELGLRTQVLRRVEIFAPLTDPERQELAGRLGVAPFVKGETIARQGATAHNFYIITAGTVQVRLATAQGDASHVVATLCAGDFFGEMGLMTGEPRTATVIAQTDITCYRLDKEAFTDILQRRPEIAQGISHILAHRRAQLDAIREGLNEESTRQRQQSTEGDLLRRIRTFFRLDR